MKREIMAAAFAALSLAGVSSAQADTLTTGIVNADGSKQTNGPYTVTHSGTGHYVITLTNYTGVPICQFNVLDYVRLTALHVSAKTCNIQFGSGNKKGVPTDALFTFFAAPVS